MSKSDKQDATNEQMRLDKWLNYARLFKTRTKAADACSSRHVKVNGKTAKPSHAIQVNNTITIQYSGRNRTFDVVKLARRTVPAAEARELYIEHLPKISKESSEQYDIIMKLERQRQRERKGKGRPTKKERRELKKLRGK